MSSPLVSLCMIVKNEETTLPRCLESVRGAVDEMIIVDTGSTDSTREIARRYGAEVFSTQWKNDFSFHRNQSIARAKGRWILQLDADECL
ncbi:MAG: glycosyltransferase family 2 protein, partial [Deltaproteobacteria bacterium]|nr:glycosyltransferase family 2 protein [Deltaproteobacteria bacterium]